MTSRFAAVPSRYTLPLSGLVLTAMMTLTSATIGEESKHPAMQDPAKAAETAPATFTAKFETSKGAIEFECDRTWAPHGVDRFYNLVKIGFYNDVAFFRAIAGFMVQFGIHGNPSVSAKWKSANLAVDPVKKSNTKGMLTYAMAGSPTTRSTQLFINYGNNARLDKDGFAPICKVSKGMDVASKLFNEYAGKPSAKQGNIQREGNAYLKKAWPKLDYITKTSIVKEGTKAEATADADKGGSGVLPPAEKKTDTSTYIIIGLLAVGALLAFMYARNSNEQEAPPPTPKRRSPASKKKRAKKTGSSTARGKKTGSRKKRKKKRAKASSRSSED